MKLALVSLLLALPALAQEQTPARETAVVLSAVEAEAFALCRDVAAHLRDGRASGHGFDGARLSGYEMFRSAADESGRLVFDDESRESAIRWAAGEAVVYFVPTGEDPDARRVFCVRGDGIAAFTDNTVGVTSRGEHALAPDAALREGGKGSLRDFPRTPQRGRDGNLWQPLSMLPVCELRLMVVDEDRAPMAMLELACVPAPPDSAVDAPLPAGRVRTTFDGDGVLVGAAARGLGFRLRQGSIEVWVDPANVQVSGRTARVTVSRTTLNQARLIANESAAIATLKNICSAQAQCQAGGVIDANRNGAGEYGTFGELSGRVALRGGGGAQRMSPPVLSAAFGNVQGGIVVRSGYCFRMFLPGEGAAPLAEQATGGAAGLAIDARLAELIWCTYAWPVEAGVTGGRAFFVNQAGDVLCTRNIEQGYSGPAKPPAPDAAFDAAGSGKLDATGAANAKGKDGQQWSVIG